MNRFLLAASIVSIAFSSSFSSIAAQDKQAELKSLKEKASYLVGFDIGEDVLRRELDVDFDIMVQGFRDAVAKKKPPMTKTEIESVMAAFEKKILEKSNAKWKALSKKNMETGVAFLAKNKLADGIAQLESGLQYKVVKKSDGVKPKNGNQVKIHVIGKHMDGEEFENTVKIKMPVTVTVGTTLRGLDEALRRMNVGSKWQLFIPANLGFGQNGSPPAVGPNETLLYEVELLEIVK